MTISPEELRIYRAYHRLPPEIGGMERHIACLSDAQRAQGVDVVNIFNVGEASGASHRVLAKRNMNKVKPAMARDLLFYAAARRSLKRVRDDRFTVLHVHGDWSAFLASRLLTERLRPVVTVASIHSKAQRSPAFYRSALASHALLFATGYADAIRLSEWTGKKVHHLPSAPLDLFFECHPPQAQPADVIAVGNLLPNKRSDLLIACALRRPKLQFSVYGDGPARGPLEASLARSGCTNVRLHGKVDPHLIASALQSARLFINLSEIEGTPTAALEAMACGLPIVLTPSNDYSWLVRNGVNGYVTGGWNIEEILEKIDLSLANEEKRQGMATANRALAYQHRWSAKADFVTNKIIEAIEQVVP